MKNHVQNDSALDWINDTAAVVTAGSVVVIGELIGVAVTDIAVNENGTLDVRGVFRLAKDAGAAIGQGEAVGWDGDSIVAGGTHGHAAYPAAAADLTVDVLING